MSACVLVTDGGERSALAVTRALGRAGHRVIVVGAARTTLAGASRHAARGVVAPDPLADPSSFHTRIEQLARDEGVEVVLPITDASMKALLAHRSNLAGASIPFPDLYAFERASDKKLVAELAESVGIRIPEQRVMWSREALLRCASSLDYPVFLKPTRSVVGKDDRQHKTTVAVATGAADIDVLAGAIPEDGYPVLVQRRVYGPGTGLFLLRWDQQTVAAFAHQRLREKPPRGGVSVLRVSVPLDTVLLKRAEDLLDALGWHGVAMLEFKRDQETGDPYIMEINARFWGSLQLAVDAGVDFPARLVDLALGRRPEPQVDYEVGVQSRWLLGDVDHLIARLRHSAEALNLPPGSPGRLRATLDFLTAFRPGIRNEVFRLSDPRPGLHELKRWMATR